MVRTKLALCLTLAMATLAFADAKRFGVRMPDQAKMTTQERAYASPIWYTP